ncbi:MAG: DUF1080 domain-containing protein [Acidobacteriota bacterium]|nr:DUF1080 domain-containing protein [Acidobacteriota bacterium]
MSRSRLAVWLVVVGSIAGCGPAEQTVAPDETLTEGSEMAPSHNRLTEAERTAGWRLLFDGRSFDGWRGLGREDVPAGHWRIEEGTLRKVASGEVPTAADGQPLEGGDLMTVETFGDFELSLEWKVASGANSGVKYNVSEEMSTASPPHYAALGFEYQVLDDDLHPDAKVGPNRTAAGLYDLVEPAASKPIRPVGEFNEGRIVFARGHGEHWLNGERVLSYDLSSEDFAKRFARSKYAAIEGFADVREGHLVLQDHGDDVWFRNIKVRSIEAQ